MTEYQFTHDWFSQAEQVWPQLIPLLPSRQRFLEIGSFEGRSTVWIMENMMEDGGYIDCIDTWGGGEEHGEENMGDVEKRFDHNLELASDRSGIFDGDVARHYFKLKGPSTKVLASILAEGEESTEALFEDGMCATKPKYDFIYIDGSHVAKDVLTDACMAWPLLKRGGIMVFDDYMWGNPRDILHRPKPAIDAFCNIFAEEVDLIHVGYQAVIRKRGEG